MLPILWLLTLAGCAGVNLDSVAEAYRLLATRVGDGVLLCGFACPATDVRPWHTAERGRCPFIVQCVPNIGDRVPGHSAEVSTAP